MHRDMPNQITMRDRTVPPEQAKESGFEEEQEEEGSGKDRGMSRNLLNLELAPHLYHSVGYIPIGSTLLIGPTPTSSRLGDTKIFEVKEHQKEN